MNRDPSFLVDTDVLIDYLRGHPKAVEWVQSHSDRIILSSLVAAELYAGVKGEQELIILDRFLSLFPVIPVSRVLARAAGLFKNEYSKSHAIGLADAVVAATAEAENAELKTLNTRHYPMFKGLKPAYAK